MVLNILLDEFVKDKSNDPLRRGINGTISNCSSGLRSMAMQVAQRRESTPIHIRIHGFFTETHERSINVEVKPRRT